MAKKKKYKIHGGVIIACDTLQEFQEQLDKLEKKFLKEYTKLDMQQLKELEQISVTIPGAAVTITIIEKNLNYSLKKTLIKNTPD